jgi:hypothetical protein
VSLTLPAAPTITDTSGLDQATAALNQTAQVSVALTAIYNCKTAKLKSTRNKDYLLYKLELHLLVRLHQ